MHSARPKGFRKSRESCLARKQFRSKRGVSGRLEYHVLALVFLFDFFPKVTKWLFGNLGDDLQNVPRRMTSRLTTTTTNGRRQPDRQADRRQQDTGRKRTPINCPRTYDYTLIVIEEITRRAPTCQKSALLTAEIAGVKFYSSNNSNYSTQICEASRRPLQNVTVLRHEFGQCR